MRLLPTIPQVAKQFIKQIRTIYNNNPDNLIKCFMMYLGFLRTFAKLEYTELTQFQIDDMLMCIHNEKIDTRLSVLETAWVYTRRGGKTRGLTIMAIFFSIINRVVVWRAPYSSQLIQAGKWFGMNPFVKNVSISTKNSVTIFLSPEVSISVLSPGKVASLDADILIFDEGGWVFNNMKLYEYYKASTPMIAASKFKHIIHASTPARGTVIDDVYHTLKGRERAEKTRYTSIHPWPDCHWITKEFIAQEAEKNQDCPWYVDQNYNCLWVVYGGAVFTRIIALGDPNFPNFPKDYFITNNKHISYWGTDFNGDLTQHYRVGIDYNDRFIYVMEEIKFLDLSSLLPITNNIISLEVEDGLFNEKYTTQLKRMGCNCRYFAWDKIEKDLRVQEVRNRIVVIDPLQCPTTYKNLIEASYDKGSRLPQLEKRTDQHGLDALLHAMHNKAAELDILMGGVARGKTLFGSRSTMGYSDI